MTAPACPPPREQQQVARQPQGQMLEAKQQGVQLGTQAQGERADEDAPVPPEATPEYDQYEVNQPQTMPPPEGEAAQGLGYGAQGGAQMAEAPDVTADKRAAGQDEAKRGYGGAGEERLDRA